MTQPQQNPWTRQQTPAMPQPVERQGPPQPMQNAPRGPSAPQHGVPAPSEDDRLPKFAIPAADTLWWVGVHGGSGESTMSLLLPGTRAAGHRWPIPPPPVPTPTVLVARTHASGLRAAQRAAIEWASGVVQGVCPGCSTTSPTSSAVGCPGSGTSPGSRSGDGGRIPRPTTHRTRSSKSLNPSTLFARPTPRNTPPRTERLNSHAGKIHS
jgi:hypothetical protein